MSLAVLQKKLEDAGIAHSEDTVHASTDIFPADNAKSAAITAAPTSVEQVGVTVRAAYAAGVAIVPRGGGMSYTGGYRPERDPSLLLDLSSLNQVREIDTENFIAIVDSGCTWQTLSEALAASGLRSAVKGPISGSHSTIGGAASQNLPGSMDGFLGLEIVNRDGTAGWTGSAGGQHHTAFYRNYGPDLTGLFLGDAGSLGVKTGVALRLEPKPEGVAFASFGFETMEQTTAVMIELARANLGGRVFALDPIKNKTSTKVSAREGVETLAKVVKQGGMVQGLKNAAKIAMAGQKAYDNVPWSLHLTFENATQAGADAVVEKAKEICAKSGQPIDPSIPVAMYASHFSIRGFLGIKGERWVPMHSIFPLGKASQIVRDIEALFAGEKEILAKHGIVHSFMMTANGPYFLIEPMFYWQDKRLPIHENNLDARRLGKMQDFDNNPGAREAVRNIRLKLKELAFSNGAVACQLGKYYPYRNMMSDETRVLFDTLKSALDPDGLFNPGALETETG